ncbi:MAG: MltA domain-containing protein [Pseudanabaenaceae cyanobacterium bins.68]|nr:MltA domain-containing protein [Pseudanabaenaceae cyanobacterium bins.68]
MHEINRSILAKKSDLRLLFLFVLLNGLCFGTLSFALPTLGQVLWSLTAPRATIQRDRRAVARLIQVDQMRLLAATDDLLERDRAQLVQAVDYSLAYLATPSAARVYPRFDISRELMRQSLERFRELVLTINNPEELQQAIAQEFNLLQANGFDRKGTVQFTGYYEPVYQASRQADAKFRYPIYRLPPDFKNWAKPHPTRAQLEKSQRLRGLEIAYLPDLLQAFLIQVQGSAQLQLPDGTTITVGYGGKTDQPYNSIGKELVKDGKIPLAEVTLPRLIAYFQQYPQQLQSYLWRNPSFVFMRETQGRPATGSLGVPVTAERTIATDKSIFPPGAIALIRTQIPIADQQGKLSFRQVSRFVLDQDTGGAITGAGRVDIFMGTGEQAKQRAGLMSHMGELYYLVLKQ